MQATSEIFANGWLQLGRSAARSTSDGYLTITGRKKDIIITVDDGKNITPSNIKTALRQRPWISQAVVYGDNRPYLVAVLTLDIAMRLRHWPSVLASSQTRPRWRTTGVSGQALQAEVDEANRQFARIEQVKRFAVLDQ